MTLSYIFGLLNTDGSFFLIFKKDKTMKLGWRLNPVIQISLKKENVTVLKEVLSFLFSVYGIKGKVKNKATDHSSIKKNRQRAFSLEIEGILNVSKVLKIIKNSSIPYPLLGVKYYDFFIMEEIFKIISLNLQNTENGRKIVIDCVKHLHIAPSIKGFLTEKTQIYRTENSIPPSNRKSRSQIEADHGFSIGSSVGFGFDRILKAKNKYEVQYLQSLNGLLSLDPNQVSGLLDGDGSLYYKKKAKCFSLSCGEGDEALLWSFARYFGDQNPKLQKQKKRNCVFYTTTKKN